VRFNGDLSVLDDSGRSWFILPERHGAFETRIPLNVSWVSGGSPFRRYVVKGKGAFIVGEFDHPDPKERIKYADLPPVPIPGLQSAREVVGEDPLFMLDNSGALWSWREYAKRDDACIARFQPGPDTEEEDYDFACPGKWRNSPRKRVGQVRLEHSFAAEGCCWQGGTEVFCTEFEDPGEVRLANANPPLPLDQIARFGLVSWAQSDNPQPYPLWWLTRDGVLLVQGQDAAIAQLPCRWRSIHEMAGVRVGIARDGLLWVLGSPFGATWQKLAQIGPVRDVLDGTVPLVIRVDGSLWYKDTRTPEPMDSLTARAKLRMVDRKTHGHPPSNHE
jgi:hypothetical protein